MSFQVFKPLDTEPNDNYFREREFPKVYYHQQENSDYSDRNLEVIFGENKNYHQIGNVYLQYDITIRKNDNSNFIDEAKRLVNNALV